MNDYSPACEPFSTPPDGSGRPYQGDAYSPSKSPGPCAARIVTLYPASARKSAEVRPVTPALQPRSAPYNRMTWGNEGEGDLPEDYYVRRRAHDLGDGSSIRREEAKVKVAFGDRLRLAEGGFVVSKVCR